MASMPATDHGADPLLHDEWQTREAQSGNIPWVKASRYLPDLKGVKVGRKVSPELLRSSGNNRMNDRIDTG